MLDDVTSVNGFQFANQIWFTVGDSPTIYFQLIDDSKDRVDQGFVPAGRRFVPADGATLSVVFDSVDMSRQVTKVATQPYAQDPSIWSVTIVSTDTILGTVNMKLSLTEGTKVTSGFLLAALNVQSMDGMTRL